MNKKRIVALCMFLFLFGIMLLQINAFADTVATGTCGDNLNWSLDDSGTLTISGSGEMYSYFNQRGPWYSDYSKDIQKVVIEEGVTSIGDTAFANLAELTSVRLPDSLQTISREAFANCTAMETINVPAGITSIGDAAFYNCRSLRSFVWPAGISVMSQGIFRYCLNMTEITLPEGLTVIGDYEFEGCKYLEQILIPESCLVIGDGAFYGCSTVETITIPRNVEEIGSNAFACYSLTELNVDEDNQYFKSEDNVLYSKDGKRLIVFPFAKAGTGVIFSIPEGVEEIDVGAFPRGGVYNETGGSTWHPFRLGTLNVPESYTVLNNAFNDIYVTNLNLPSTIERAERSAITSGHIDNLYIQRGVAPTASATTFNDGVIGTIHVPEGSRGYDVSPWTKATVVYDLDPIPLEGIRFEQDEYYYCNTKDISICIATIPFDSTETYSITYSFSNDSVLNVSQDGVLTAFADGEVVVTATSGKHSANCTVVIGHKYSNWIITTYPTEEGEGVEQKECLVCGETISKKIPSIQQVMSYSDFTLPDKLTTVMEEAFANFSARIVKCNEALLTIHENAFINSDNLEAVYLPKSITTIEDNVFLGCKDGLVIFGYAGSYAQNYSKTYGYSFVPIG